MVKESQKNKDALHEASLILQAPYKNTKKKILVAVNLSLVIITSLHLAIQLISFGHLPDPARDMIMIPLTIVIHAFSAYHHSRLLAGKSNQPRWVSQVSTWASLITLQLFALATVHVNVNTATSLIVDSAFSIILVFITGTVINRNAATVWLVISLISFFIAYGNRGSSFEYHLMTQQEVKEYKENLKSPDRKTRTIAKKREEIVKQEKIEPLSIKLYVSVCLIFLLLAFLPSFFQANMIGQVLKSIPQAIEKIELAADEKNLLKKENVRMSMELDIAKHIQKMVLPREEEFMAFKGLEIGARMDTATEVGGDFYEVLPQKDGSIYFGIGDVTDHGLQSGVVMLMTQAAFRATLDNNDVDITSALNQINSILHQNISRMKDQRNLTLSLLHYLNGTVSMTGQHETVILLKKKEDFAEQIDTMDLGLYVGLIDDFSDHVQESSFDMEIGDIMLLYTDGATEALNNKDREFGIQGLMQSLERHRHHPSQQIVNNIIDEIYEYTGKTDPEDDITIVVVRRTA